MMPPAAKGTSPFGITNSFASFTGMPVKLAKLIEG